MGLGRLNPGCNDCGCVPIPQPVGCQFASQILDPISLTLECPVVSLTGGYLIYQGFQIEPPCTPAVYVPNQGSKVHYFPPWPNANCVAYLIDEYGYSTKYSNVNVYERGYWEFAQSGGCRFAFTNFEPSATTNDISSIGRFIVQLGITLQPGSTTPLVSINITHQLRIVQTYRDDEFGELCDINYPMFTGQADPDANYYIPPNDGFSFDYQQKQSVSDVGGQAYTRIGYQFQGCSYRAANCPSYDYPFTCWFIRDLEIRSGWFLYPTLNSQRVFQLWQPSPQIDPWGLLNQSVTATLSLGID